MNNQNTNSDKPKIVCPGPTSDAGKATSSKNALKHGCCAASTLILDQENIEDYKALEASWCQAYMPQCEAERHLVQELINADWLLQRVTAAHARIERDLYTLHESPSDWTESQERKLGRHLRYKTAQANLVAKARKAVEDYRKARLNEQAMFTKQAIAGERLNHLKNKNRPQASWKEHLENMKQQALSMGIIPPIDPRQR